MHNICANWLLAAHAVGHPLKKM